MKLIGKNIFFNEHEVLHKGNYKEPIAEVILFKDGQSLQEKYDKGLIGGMPDADLSDYVTNKKLEEVVNDFNILLNQVHEYYSNKIFNVMEESCRTDINILATLNTSNKPVQAIKPKVEQITLSTGETSIIEYTITPSNSSNKGIVFISGNIDVVTVDHSGKLTGIGPGTTDILLIATDGTNTRLTDDAIIDIYEHNDNELRFIEYINVFNYDKSKKNPPIFQKALKDGLANKVYAIISVTVN